MPKIFKPAGKSKFVVFYTNHIGRRCKKTLTEDFKISERIAAALVEKVELRKAGLIDERDELFAEHEATPIADHLADYAKVVRGQGATEKHVRGLVFNVERVLALAKIKRISQFTLWRVEDAINTLRKTCSAGTINICIQRLKSFNKWLVRNKRAREYALADLKTRVVKANDRKRIRRRLTDDEVLAVIGAAEHSGMVRGLSGPDRAMLYRLAHGTGFRASELAALTPEGFRMDDDPPTVTVLACYTKNKQKATQPIAAALADRLKPWLAGKRPGRPVFDGMPAKAAAMLRADLEAAGVPYETDDGVADFHASRGTYISNLVASGASVKTCQELARHANPSLTIGVYARVSLHDKQGAVESLPDLTPSQPTTEAMAATGTDGCVQWRESATRDSEDDPDDSPNGPSSNGLRAVSAEDGRVRLQRRHDRRETTSQASGLRVATGSGDRGTLSGEDEDRGSRARV